MQMWEIPIRLLLAILIGVIIGVEREKKNRPAGMRTHVLVCTGAALIAVAECRVMMLVMETNLANPDSGITVAMGRMCAQVVSGVGFLGAGTIFVTQKKIAGLTTAASLWCAACLGITAGLGLYVIATSGAIVVIVVLTLLQKVIHVHQINRLEVVFYHRTETLEFLNSYFKEIGAKVIDIDFRAITRDGVNEYTNLYTIDLPKKTASPDIVLHLSEHKNIRSVNFRNV